MTATEARKRIADEAYEPEAYEEAVEIYEAIFECEPPPEWDQGTLWSHVCAAVPMPEKEQWDPERHAEWNGTDRKSWGLNEREAE